MSIRAAQGVTRSQSVKTLENSANGERTTIPFKVGHPTNRNMRSASYGVHDELVPIRKAIRRRVNSTDA
jgi:hypothetical protein